MVYNSAVGSTPAFLVAATGSIPAFSLPVRIFGQAVLSKESATPGVTIVYGSFLSSLSYCCNPAEVSGGWTHFPDPGQTRR